MVITISLPFAFRTSQNEIESMMAWKMKKVTSSKVKNYETNDYKKWLRFIILHCIP